MGRIWMSQVIDAIADLGRNYLERPSHRNPRNRAFDEKIVDTVIRSHRDASRGNIKRT